MASNSEEMSIDFGRFSVPLKHICSKKWEMPLISFVSYLEPASTKIKTVVVKLSFIGIVIILNPFFKIILSGILILRTYDVLNFFDFYSFLFHRIAIANGYRIVFQCLKVNRNTIRRADFVLTVISFPDISPIIPSNIETIDA